MQEQSTKKDSLDFKEVPHVKKYRNVSFLTTERFLFCDGDPLCLDVRVKAARAPLRSHGCFLDLNFDIPISGIRPKTSRMMFHAFTKSIPVFMSPSLVLYFSFFEPCNHTKYNSKIGR